MTGTAYLLTRIELDLLSFADTPKSFTALRHDVELFVEDLRPSTVSGLLDGLVNAGLLAKADNAYVVTQAGKAATVSARCPVVNCGAQTQPAELVGFSRV